MARHIPICDPRGFVAKFPEINFLTGKNSQSVSGVMAGFDHISDDLQDSPQGEGRMFPPTHWSWIEAVKKDGPERRRALEELCQTGVTAV